MAAPSPTVAGCDALAVAVGNPRTGEEEVASLDDLLVSSHSSSSSSSSSADDIAKLLTSSDDDDDGDASRAAIARLDASLRGDDVDDVVDASIASSPGRRLSQARTASLATTTPPAAGYGGGPSSSSSAFAAALARQRHFDRDDDWEASITPNGDAGAGHDISLHGAGLLQRMGIQPGVASAAAGHQQTPPRAATTKGGGIPSATAVMLTRAGVVYRAFKDHWAAQQSRIHAFMHAFPGTLSERLQDRHRRLVNRDNWIPIDCTQPPESHPGDVLLPAALTQPVQPPQQQQPAVSLRAHQVDGIRFLWDRLVEVPCLTPDAVEQNGTFFSSQAARASAPHTAAPLVPVPGTGCILAHSMGLGKTCQVIGFLTFFFQHIQGARVLLLVPKSTLVSWASELATWARRFAPAGAAVFPVTVFDDSMKRSDRINRLKQWTLSRSAVGETAHRQTAGLFMMSYEQAVFLTSGGLSAGSLHMDLVVCDEGHRLKSDKRQDTQMIRELRTRRRLILTGTPLQNYLKEYFVMIDVVMPLYFPKKMFRDFFAKPISASMSKTADPKTIELARQRTFTLIQEVEPFVQRRDGSVLAAELPPLTEFIVVVPLTPLQARLYDRLLGILRDQGRKVNVLQGFSYAAKLCAHPQVLFDTFRQLALGEFAKIDHSMLVVDSSDDDGAAPPNGNGATSSKNNGSDPKKDRDTLRQQFALLCQPPPRYAARSNDSVKLQVALELVRSCLEAREKVLVFSMSTVLLDFFANMLSSAAEQANMPALGDYLRIDGSSSSSKRKEQIETFQKKPQAEAAKSKQKPRQQQQRAKRSRDSDEDGDDDDEGLNADDDGEEEVELEVSDEEQRRHSIFLLSTKAGGVGLTLTAATRIIILDCSWNPADDRQAVGRAYRYGQTKPVFVYRLVCQGTLEHRVYDQKVAKEWLFQTVVESEVLRRDKLRGSKLQNILVRSSEPPSPAAIRDTDSCCRMDPILGELRPHLHHVVTHHSVLTEDEDKYGDRERMYYDQLQKQGGVMALAVPDIAPPPPMNADDSAQRLRREEMAVASASRSLAQVLQDIIERRRALFASNPNAPQVLQPHFGPTLRRRPQPQPRPVEGPGASKLDALTIDDSDDDGGGKDDGEDNSTRRLPPQTLLTSRAAAAAPLPPTSTSVAAAAVVVPEVIDIDDDD